MTWMTRVKVVALVSLTGALFAGCPTQGVVCQAGTSACGDVCVDLKADQHNCGACGTTCAAGQVCQSGSCQCQEGLSICGSACVDLKTDSQHCGACGTACEAGQVCEADGQGGASCKVQCETAGNTICGNSCVSLSSDSSNCGACGNVCENGRACKRGVCLYDAVAACRNFGQVVGFRYTDGGVFVGPRTNLGTTPGVLTSYGDVLFDVDDTDNRVLQADLQTFNQLAQDAGTVSVGFVPTQILVAAPYAYVVNAASNTMQILQLGGDLDAGALHPNGFGLATVGEYNFGSDTSPEGVALIGQKAYVPLYGGFTTATIDAGQSVVKLDLANPTTPVPEQSWDLNTLDLEPFGDAGFGNPRPFAILEFKGKLYVPLNNMNPDTYKPAGPGILAQIDPATAAPSKISLGAECLNPVSLAAFGNSLLVSCAGRVTYNSTYTDVLSVDGSGVVMLQPDSNGSLQIVSRWAPTCPTGSSCPPANVGRLSAANGRVAVTDQFYGRIWLLRVTGNQLTELPTVSPLQACELPDSTHPSSNVTDVLAIP